MGQIFLFWFTLVHFKNEFLNSLRTSTCFWYQTKSWLLLYVIENFGKIHFSIYKKLYFLYCN